MWIPTHVKVTVHKARNLKVKGRSGVNDPYVAIHLDDMKYTTSVKTRNTAPEWNENYDMPIPTDLRNCVVRLSVHHRNLFTKDDFLGQTSISLQQYPIYDRPQSRWYSLAGRRGSRKASDDEDKVIEGEVQVTLTFMVQSQSTPSEQTVAPSSGFERQRSLSFRSLASRVGMKLNDRWRSQNDLKDSPLTDLTERKFPVHSVLELDNISRSFHRLQLSPADDEDEIFAPSGHSTQVPVSDAELSTPERNPLGGGNLLRKRRAPDARFQNNDQEVAENSSSEGTCSTLQGMNPSPTTNGEILRKRPVRPQSLQTLTEESQESKTNETMERMNNARNVNPSPLSPGFCETPVYPNNYIRVAHQRHSYVGCGETPPMVAAYRLNEIDDFMTTEKQRVSSSATTYQPPSQQNFHPEDKDHFNGYDRDDLIRLVLEQQSWIQQRQAYVQDLEIYIDSLLIRVLDTNTQAILENPYNETGKRLHKLRKADDSQKKALDKSKKKRLIDLFKIWKQ